MSSLPDRLRWAREIAGISQRELSRLAGLKSQRHVGLIEASERPNLVVETVSGIAAALGVSIDWLVHGTGEPPSEHDIRAAVKAAQDRVAVLPNGSAA